MKTFLHGLLGAVTVLAVARADAQTVSGKVRDGKTAAPLGNVEVTLLRGTEQIGRTLTSDSGAFSIPVTAPGSYRLDLRRVGYSPVIGRSVDLSRSEGIELTMEPIAQRLDTVRTVESVWKSKLTPGKEIVRQHLLLGKGIIVSGLDIERSGMLLSAYLGTLDGIKLQGVATPRSPALPGKEGFLAGSGRGRLSCLYARVNHSSLLQMLMQRTAETIDHLLKLQEIMAVEIYRSPDEIPREWRMDMIVDDLFERQNSGTDYIIGNSGAPIDWMTLQHDSINFGTLRAFTVRDTTLLKKPLGAGIPNRVRGPSRSPPRMHSIPQCAFVQIWTRLAWD